VTAWWAVDRSEELPFQVTRGNRKGKHHHILVKKVFLDLIDE